MRIRRVIELMLVKTYLKISLSSEMGDSLTNLLARALRSASLFKRNCSLYTLPLSFPRSCVSYFLGKNKMLREVAYF